MSKNINDIIDVFMNKVQSAVQDAMAEMVVRETALQNKVGELKSDGAVLAERYDEMKDAAFAEAKTIEYLRSERSKMQDCITLRENQNLELKEKVQELLADITMLKQQRAVRKKETERLKCDLTIKTSQAEEWREEYEETKKELQRQQDISQGYYDSMMTFKQQLEEAKADMAVLHRDVEFYARKYNELAKLKAQ